MMRNERIGVLIPSAKPSSLAHFRGIFKLKHPPHRHVTRHRIRQQEMDTSEVQDTPRASLFRKNLVFLTLSLGIPCLLLEIVFGRSSLGVVERMQNLVNNPDINIENRLPLVLTEIQNDLKIHLVGWCFQFFFVLIAYYGSITLWVKAHRSQEVPHYVRIWLESARFSAIRGFLVFLVLLLLVGPLQLWSLYVGGYFSLIFIVLVGGLLLMAPVLITVNPSMGFLKAISDALFTKYARPPIQSTSLRWQTTTNLTLIYMISQGIYGFSYLGEKIVLPLSLLPHTLSDWFFRSSPLFASFSPAFIVGHLLSLLIKILVIAFVTHGTVKLYFSLGQRRKIGEF